MVARLVAVGVLADQAGNVAGNIVAGELARSGEEGVQRLERLSPGTEALLQAVQVVRDKPGVLPGVAFGVGGAEMVGVIGIEGLEEAAAAVLAPHEAGFGVEEVAVAVAALQEVRIVFLLAEFLGGLGEGPVGDGILHVEGQRLVEEVCGNIAVLHAQVLSAVGKQGGGLHRLKGLLGVKAGNALGDGVRHRGDTRIADHAVGLVAVEVPDRQFALAPVDLEEGVHKITLPLRLQDGIERHGGAVGVPEGEDRVFGLGAMVAEEGGSDKGVIESRVENLAVFLVGSGEFHLSELVVPFPAGGVAGGLEVPAGEFRGQVLFGAFETCDGERHLQEHLLTFVRL